MQTPRMYNKEIGSALTTVSRKLHGLSTKTTLVVAGFFIFASAVVLAAGVSRSSAEQNQTKSSATSLGTQTEASVSQQTPPTGSDTQSVTTTTTPASSSSPGSSSVQVNVDGQQISVPANSSLNKTIQTNGNTTTVSVQNTHSGSTTNVSSQSTNVQMNSFSANSSGNFNQVEQFNSR